MEERRKFKRRYLAFYSRVFDVRSHHLLGHIVDITPQGLMLLSEIPLPLDAVFRLEIELPDDFNLKRTILFDATTRWCQPDVDPNFYNTGFQLSNISTEDIGIIQNIVDTFGFRDN